MAEGKVALLSGSLEFINNENESNNNSPINLLAREGGKFSSEGHLMTRKD